MARADEPYITLSAEGQTYELTLSEGARSIQELSATPSNIRITQGGQKFGEFDPAFSHIEMRDWSNGRGREYYVDDPAAFFDGTAWTLTPGQWHQPPMWGHSIGPSNVIAMLPGNPEIKPLSPTVPLNVNWYQMLSTEHWARGWESSVPPGSSAGTTYTASEFQIMLRRIGQPSRLNVRLYSGSSVNPDSSAVVASTTLNATSVEEHIIQMPTFAFSTGVNVSTATGRPWLEVFTTVAGAQANHWEVAFTGQALSFTFASTGDGTSGGWSTNITRYMYFKAASTQVKRKWHFFEMDRGLYAASERKDGGTVELYINGDRGLATSNSNSTRIVDNNGDWAFLEWPGARVQLIRGTGFGQNRLISNNGTTTLSVTPAFDIAPSSNTEYVIYNTNRWRKLPSTVVSSLVGANHPVRDIAVAQNIAYFAFGQSTTIGKLRWDSSANFVHESAKNTTTASSHSDLFEVFSDPIDGEQLWSAQSTAGEVRHGGAQGFSSNIQFETGIQVGSSGYEITGLEDYNDQMYVFKEDSLWTVKNDRSARLNVGLEGFTSSNNGLANLATGLFLYFSYSHSVERLFSGTLDDIGPWRNAGMPPGRQGPIRDLKPLIGWVAAGLDAGSTGVSSILLWNDRGWHEIYRAPTSGYQVESLWFQSNPNGAPKLWASVGGEIVGLTFPRDTLNPLNAVDSSDANSMRFWPEGIVVSPTIDMGVTQIPKLFDELSAITHDLTSSNGTELHVDYQLDDDIGSSNWQPIGAFVQSPSDTRKINRGDKKAIRFRSRAYTGNTGLATRVDAQVLKAVARTPIKRQWNVRLRTGKFRIKSNGLPDASPEDLYLFLQNAAVTATPLQMQSRWPEMSGIHVFAEQPSVFRSEESPFELNLVLREV